MGSIILTVMAFSLLGAEYVRAEDAKPSEKVTVTVSRGFPGTMNPEMILAQIGPDIPPPPGEDMEHEGTRFQVSQASRSEDRHVSDLEDD